MGKDFLYNNMNFADRAAARAVCLGSLAERGDCGGCDSASVARLGSHAARGSSGAYTSARSHDAHSGCGLARTMRAQREVLGPRSNYLL